MNVRMLLGITSMVLTIGAAIPYFLAVIRGHAKLERGAYTIWLVLPIIALVTQILEGGGESLGLAIGDTFTAFIFFVMIFKYGYGGVAKRDLAALFVAGLGIVLWLYTNNPLLALFAAIFVDSVGSALIIIKAYEAPQTEVASSWVLYLAGGLCALFAVSNFTIALIAYPIYAVASSVFILVSQHIGFRRLANHAGSHKNTSEYSKHS